jgi:hypothetical protein
MGIETHSAPEIAAGNTVLHGQAVLAVCDGCPVGNRENAWGGGEDRKKLPNKKTHHQRCNLGFKKQLSARSETRNPERSATPPLNCALREILAIQRGAQAACSSNLQSRTSTEHIIQDSVVQPLFSLDHVALCRALSP